jgi:aromatic ring-opening dioxygenase LigB subunit
MFRHTWAILRENVDINKTFIIQRQMRQWKDNNTHTFLTWTPHVVVAQHHVAVALNYEKSSLCPNDSRLCGLHIPDPVP